MTFKLIIWHKTSEDINNLPDKSRRIIKSALERLKMDPFPGRQGDKEKLELRDGIIIYRLHISRSYTAFYEIDREDKLVIVQDVLTIQQAHKKYGYY